jgi:hypothetical protein
MRVKHCFSSNKKDHAIEISELSAEEKEKFEGMVNGMWWVRGVEGVPVFSPAFEKIPSPVEDPKMAEFWPRKEKNQSSYSQVAFRDKEEYKYNSPGITIQHLCGYYYTPEKYALEAEKLRSYGFSCLRSPRDREGRYHEHWYLGGFYSAQGDLDWHIVRIKQDQEKDKMPADERDTDLTEKVVRFLCKNVSFGTLDLVTQRAAMVMDD